MQKSKIEEDFAEKARLVQLELEREREKAKSEKEKYETEKAKLEHERKRLEQLQIEIWEREERNTTPVNINKSSSNPDISLCDDKSTNVDGALSANKSDQDLKETAIVHHHEEVSNDGTASRTVSESDHMLDSTATTVLGVGNDEHSSEFHENIHGLQQTATLTDAELLEREKQLLLQQERLDALQNGKLSANHTTLDSNTPEILQFLTEKEKIEQQRLLLEKAKFLAESKAR